MPRFYNVRKITDKKIIKGYVLNRQQGILQNTMVKLPRWRLHMVAHLESEKCLLNGDGILGGIQNSAPSYLPIKNASFYP